MSDPNITFNGQGKGPKLGKTTKWAIIGSIALLVSPMVFTGMAVNSMSVSSGVIGAVIGKDSKRDFFAGANVCSSVSDAGSVDSGATSLVGGLQVPEKAVPWIAKANESSGGIPKSYLAAMMNQESSFRPGIYAYDSNGGTWGLFQINREEWTKFYPDASGTPPTGITDPLIHAEVGGRYLRDRLDGVIVWQRNHPDLPAAKIPPLEALVIAHNAGEGWLPRYPSLPSVTQKYLANIIRNTGADITWTPSGPADTGPVTGDTVATSCSSTSGGTITGGSVPGGAPIITSAANFSWMCDTMNVCKAGDFGSIFPGTFGYQCTWYAWTRLAMIHGKNGWDVVHGNGGDIWRNAQGKPGWIVDQTPHPGDGVSATHAQAPLFAGTTHVAVVEEVADDPSGWKIRISEGNMRQGEAAKPCYYQGTKGCWNSYRGDRWLTKAQIGGVHFFRNQAWGTTAA